MEKVDIKSLDIEQLTEYVVSLGFKSFNAKQIYSWLHQKKEITSVLVGASCPEQIIENVKMLDNIEFSSDELNEIDEITKGK